MCANSYKPPRVLVIVPAMIPTPLIYGIKPLSTLAQKGLIILDSVAEAEVSPESFNWADLVVFCRNCEPLFDHNLQQILERNIPFVYDLDDNYWDLDPESKDGQYLRAPHRLKQTERYLRYANLVRVFNHRLYQKVSQFTQHVLLLEPCIDLKLTPKKPLIKNDQIIRIVYVTTRGNEDPFLDIITDPLIEILTKNPERTEVTFWGDSGNRFKHLTNVHNLPIISNYEQFLQILSRTGFDIGLAPINPNPFTLAKTNTKFRDYGACRIAGIYTNCEIYNTHIINEQTGILTDNSTDSWYQAIERLISNEPLRKFISEKAYQYVAKYFNQEIMETNWLMHINDLLPAVNISTDKNYGHRTLINTQKIESKNKQIKVNLGHKYEVDNNFYCLYNSELPDVDVQLVVDLSIPLKSNSVDLLLADHVLNNSCNVMSLLHEIYRVCKHGAQVCIIVPYHTNQVSLVNPKQTITFNEYTPWYWSEFHPSWLSLSGPENSYFWNTKISQKDFAPPSLDIRLVRIAFNYLAGFRNLSPVEQEEARHKYFNVCDQIVYHLVVIKNPTTEDEVNNMTGRWQYYEPPKITARRYQDLFEFSVEQNQKCKLTLSERENELKDSQQKIEFLQEQIDNRNLLIEEENKKMQILQVEIEQLRLSEQKYKHISDELLTTKSESDQFKKRNVEIESSLEKYNNDLIKITSSLETSQVEIDHLKNTLSHIRLEGINTALALNNYRESRVMRMVRRLRDRTDARNDISPDFQQHLDDSILFHPNIESYLLQSSNNLQNLLYIEYPITWNKPHLSQISVALIADFSPTTGIFGLELVNPENVILLHMHQNIVNIDIKKPVSFYFNPIQETQSGNFLLRMFVRELDAPVRVFEWRKYPLFGFSRINKLAFCAFRFSN